jgi:hypothetical protein
MVFPCQLMVAGLGQPAMARASYAALLWILGSRLRKSEGGWARLLCATGLVSSSLLALLLARATGGPGRGTLRMLLGLPARPCTISGTVEPGFEEVHACTHMHAHTHTHTRTYTHTHRHRHTHIHTHLHTHTHTYTYTHTRMEDTHKHACTHKHTHAHTHTHTHTQTHTHTHTHKHTHTHTHAHTHTHTHIHINIGTKGVCREL